MIWKGACIPLPSKVHDCTARLSNTLLDMKHILSIYILKNFLGDFEN